jgi:hypothetical protein
LTKRLTYGSRMYTFRLTTLSLSEKSKLIVMLKLIVCNAIYLFIC